ncbi:unnamed protein product [Protopolystoma xenopodis]|uniref:Uncharacterized protein n=1 Tax=Protopolystoma xenopodis TaxID=117903 RepID=A0A3S5AKY3_9PLAT|nr:unnamed protein product [Protopolystoma xenopodis]
MKRKRSERKLNKTGLSSVSADNNFQRSLTPIKNKHGPPDQLPQLQHWHQLPIPTVSVSEHRGSLEANRHSFRPSVLALQQRRNSFSCPISSIQSCSPQTHSSIPLSHGNDALNYRRPNFCNAAQNILCQQNNSDVAERTQQSVIMEAAIMIATEAIKSYGNQLIAASLQAPMSDNRFPLAPSSQTARSSQSFQSIWPSQGQNAIYPTPNSSSPIFPSFSGPAFPVCSPQTWSPAAPPIKTRSLTWLPTSLDDYQMPPWQNSQKPDPRWPYCKWASLY